MPMRYTPIILCLLAVSAAADDVTLKNGKVYTGQVTEEASRYTIVDRDRKYAVSKDAVARIVKKKSFMDEYEARLAKLPVDDAEAIFEFGQWLEKNEWPTRALRAFEEVLLLDPDHRAARRKLGYKLFEGEWVSPDELKRRQGLVQFDDGRWYTKHDLAQLKAEIQRDEKRRIAYEKQRKVNATVGKLVHEMATLSKTKRNKAYQELNTYVEQVNSPELRKFAGDAKAYYDTIAKRLCHQMKTRTQINATLTRLKKPIETFETTLGAAIAVIAAQNPVKIQLPELSVASISTTVDIPTDCG